MIPFLYINTGDTGHWFTHFLNYVSRFYHMAWLQSLLGACGGLTGSLYTFDQSGATAVSSICGHL